MKLPICPPDAELRRTSVSRPGSGHLRAQRRTRRPGEALTRVLLPGGMALLAVCLLAPSARAACTPASPANNANVVCNGADSTGFDGSGADNLTITTGTNAVLTDADPGLDAAIVVDDDSTVTIGQDATVQVTQQNGAGIRGDDDNFIDNKGRIELDADDTRGISIDQNTNNLFVPGNGAVNSGTIQVDGNRSYAIETRDAGVATSGLINLVGDDTRGISAGNRTDFSKSANATNSGTINVLGDGAFGMKFGDNWLDGSFQDTDNDNSTPTVFVPSAGGIRNQGGTIAVGGNGATGIYAGDDANADGDHDSFVINSGTITVTGTGAVGISVGGNGRLDRIDLDVPNSLDGLATLNNSGSITGDADAGPLVEIRDFVVGKENRIRNSGEILADLTNQGMVDRAIAIRGTNADEWILNSGEIQGIVELNDGNDRFVQLSNATFTGTLLGGAGVDDLLLAGSASTTSTFDLALLQGFETVQVRGGPWSLTHSETSTLPIEIFEGGLLDVPTPITLGGDLTVDDGGTLRVTLDGTTPPLTIQGVSTFDGRLVVQRGSSLTPSDTAYRVIDAPGGYSGRFDQIEFPDASGTRRFTSEYIDEGLQVFFQDVGLLGAAQGSNQRAIAQNLLDLTNAGGSSDDLQAFLDGLTDLQNVSEAYTAVSPEPYDAQTTVSVEAGRRIAALLFDRPRDCQTGDVDPWDPNHRAVPCHEHRVSPWAATLGSFRSRDKFDGHNRYDAQLGGLIAGVDVQPIPDLDLTFAVSSQRGSIDVSSAGESTLTLAELTGAAAWQWGGLRVQGVATWGHGFHQDRRRVLVKDPADPVDTRGTEDHESDRALLATEIGYRVPVGPVGVEPLVGFDWAWMIQDEIQESGAGGFGLDVDDRDDQIGAVRAGVRLTSVYEHKTYLGPWLEWMTGIWRPSFDLAWRQYVEGDERDLDARLQGSADGVGGFTIQGKEDAGGAEIGVGFRLVPSYANRLRFDVRYQAYVAEHTLEQDLVGQIAYTF